VVAVGGTGVAAVPPQATTTIIRANRERPNRPGNMNLFIGYLLKHAVSHGITLLRLRSF
jgi:hypothetical protein